MDGRAQAQAQHAARAARDDVNARARYDAADDYEESFYEQRAGKRGARFQ